MDTNLTVVDDEFDIFTCLQYEQENNCKDNPVKFNAIGLAMLASRDVDNGHLAEVALMYLEAIADALSRPAPVYQRLRQISESSFA